MRLREALLKEHSKAQCTKIVNWVGSSQERFDQLFRLFMTDEYRVVQRAAWPVSYCVEAYPTLIKEHFSLLLKNMRNTKAHPAVKRNIVRLLQYVTIPKKYQGIVMDACFNYMADVNEAIAVKASSISVLENLSRLYPEIIPEVKTIIDERWDHETSAFRHRAKRFLKKMALKK
jgi:hypothetical protein